MTPEQHRQEAAAKMATTLDRYLRKPDPMVAIGAAASALGFLIWRLPREHRDSFLRTCCNIIGNTVAVLDKAEREGADAEDRERGANVINFPR